MTVETITWHPTAERLPDADLTVLVACDTSEPHTEPVWLGYLDGEQWRDTMGDAISVTHWAAMPEGPTALASPAAPHPAQQAGGMVMVPRVPTEEMMYRGGEATSGLVDWGADSFPDDAPGNLASAVYAAMLTAAPAIPAQQAQPMTDEWAEAQRIRDLPAVDDAIRNMLEDQTGDNATCMVREVLRAGSLPAQQAGQPEDAACPDCGGSGEEDASGFGDIVTCETCRGSGRAAMSSPTAKKGEGA